MSSLMGEGLQCRVYRSGGGRVLKVPTTHRQKIALLEKWQYGRTCREREAAARDAMVSLHKSLQGLKAVIAYANPALIGNPTLLPRWRYEQDHIRPLGDYMMGHSLPENKRIVSAYVDSIIRTWRYGFADTVFNFIVNCGVVRERVILLDLGELTFSKNKVRSQIEKRFWLSQSSYMALKGKSEPLGDYLEEQMNERLTSDALDRHWKADLRR